MRTRIDTFLYSVFLGFARCFLFLGHELTRYVSLLSSPLLSSPLLSSPLTQHKLHEINSHNLSFAEIYGMDRGHLSPYVNRRTWRILDLVAPSLKLPSKTDIWARDYPFSVKAERPLTVADIEAFQRDHYEGTEFDTTKGPMGGPWGDPARYDGGAVDGMTKPELLAGAFERVISLFRTSYSFVTQSRPNTDPEATGVDLALTWFGQFTPHASTYVPVYAAVDMVPSSLSRGSLFEMDRGANFWAHCTVGNYASHWYVFTIEDIKELQNELESKWFEDQSSVEEEAAKLAISSPDEAKKYLQDYCEKQATTTLSRWWSFFDYMVAKFHDGYIVKNRFAEMIVPDKLFYPRWWLESVGYWGRVGETSSERAKELEEEGEFDYDKIYMDKDGKTFTKPGTASTTYSNTPAVEGVGGAGGGSHLFMLVLGIALGVGGGFAAQKYWKNERRAHVYERV